MSEIVQFFDDRVHRHLILLFTVMNLGMSWDSR